jgi:hypothetical protein
MTETKMTSADVSRKRAGFANAAILKSHADPEKSAVQIPLGTGIVSLADVASGIVGNLNVTA